MTIVSRCLLIVLVCVTLNVIASADEPSVPALSGKPGTPIQLFNGKDLTGWTFYSAPSRAGRDGATPAAAKLEDVWSVADGVIKTKGRPNGYIRTDKAFKNYVLTVEQRHVTRGNGGLLVGIREEDKIWPGLEIQTMTANAGDLWNHNFLKMTTDPARTQMQGRRITKIGPDSQKPVGEWDTVELTIDSGNLIYRVNEKLQNVATLTADLSGQVGLQSEGAEMEYRKIQLTPIE